MGSRSVHSPATPSRRLTWLSQLAGSEVHSTVAVGAQAVAVMGCARELGTVAADELARQHRGGHACEGC